MHKDAKFIACFGVPLFLFTGCAALMGLEERKVVVVDQRHKPIEGAGVFPQPLIPGVSETGKDGRFSIYVLNSWRCVEIFARGYNSKWFAFDQPGNECMLLKK